jgi:hypothetical protein
LRLVAHQPAALAAGSVPRPSGSGQVLFVLSRRARGRDGAPRRAKRDRAIA